MAGSGCEQPCQQRRREGRRCCAACTDLFVCAAARLARLCLLLLIRPLAVVSLLALPLLLRPLLLLLQELLRPRWWMWRLRQSLALVCGTACAEEPSGAEGQ
jgi:hypothetical protein